MKAMNCMTAVTCVMIWGCSAVPDVTFVDTQTEAAEAGPDGGDEAATPDPGGPQVDHGPPNRDR